MVNKWITILSILILILVSSSMVLAEEVHLINSEDWVDVYSGMLYSGLKGDLGFFINSDSIVSLLQSISKEDTIHLYQSVIDPFIPNLGDQLTSLNYNIQDESILTNTNYDLDPQTGKYYLVSLDNPRITSSIAPVAIQNNAWVFIVDSENADAIVERIDLASEVIAVGKFPREVLQKIQPHLTEHIANDDIYKDSRDLADKLENTNNYVLTDGEFIESEFFLTNNPVLLSGPNKILTQTYNYLESKDAKAVILVGNELSVVGEQIRTLSDKKISVFVKFGQGDTKESGKVYALSVFPLPIQEVGLAVQQAIYDPVREELIVTFKNIGNSGLYELTNLRILNTDDELGSTATTKIDYISAGELLPVIFPMALDVADIDSETLVHFYTSFGISSNELDIFMTLPNSFTPPYIIPLTVKEIDGDDSLLYIQDVSYYAAMNRVGITITNPGDETVYLTAKVHDLIINGLETTLSKDDSIKARETKRVYLPAQMDLVDLDDNEVFDIVVNYGHAADFQFKVIAVEQPFKVVSGGRITGFVTGLGDGKPGSWVAIIAVVIILLVLVRLMKHKKKPVVKKQRGRKSK